VAAARTKAQEQVKQAREGIEREKIAAQEGLQSESTRLATEIVRTVLRPVTAGSPVGGAQ
jgi:F0F1-type ATP synthase membrane subunit b/b'